MDQILNQKYRILEDQRSLTSTFKNQKPSRTQRDFQFMIETILKQYNSKSRNPKPPTSQFQKEITQKKFVSQTPCNQSRLSYLFKMGIQPQTTKAIEPHKAMMFFKDNEKLKETETIKTVERQSTIVQDETVSSYLYGYKNQTFRNDVNKNQYLFAEKYEDEDDENHNLQTEIEVQNTDYMLDNIKQTYERNNYNKLIKLNDLLIDESAMNMTNEKDLAQKVPYVWQQQSDEGTTLSRSNSADHQLNQKDKTQQFKDSFIVGKQIGSGSYASVRHCIDRKTLKPYALKIYSKISLTVSRKKSILREIRLLQYIKHPNIIKIYDAVETNNHVNLLLELVEGKSLAQLYKTAPFTIPQIKNIVYQVALALTHLHRQLITHRDIKLENILFTSKEEVKLIDFGFSTLMRVKKKMFCGTPSYMAPEIVGRTEFKGQPSDVWALGITLFALLCQQFPFKGTNDKDLYSKISFGEFSLGQVDSEEARDLLRRMICTNVEARITSEEILKHPWLCKPVVIDKFSILLNRVKQQKQIQQTSPFFEHRQGTIKTFKYNLPKKNSFFQNNTQIVKSCLNSPREREDSIPYLQQNQQSTVKKNNSNYNDDIKINSQIQKNYFKAPFQHNQTIQPSFVPSFMSSVQSVKSYDSNRQNIKNQKGSNGPNLTFNDTSGLLNISFNNSVLQNEQSKLFQNLINKIPKC